MMSDDKKKALGEEKHTVRVEFRLRFVDEVTQAEITEGMPIIAARLTTKELVGWATMFFTEMLDSCKDRVEELAKAGKIVDSQPMQEAEAKMMMADLRLKLNQKDVPLEGRLLGISQEVAWALLQEISKHSGRMKEPDDLIGYTRYGFKIMSVREEEPVRFLGLEKDGGRTLQATDEDGNILELRKPKKG
jgi:hypothetical protein